MLRALWETSWVLAAIATPEEHDLRERWLDDQNLPYGATVRAIEKTKDLPNALMKRVRGLAGAIRREPPTLRADEPPAR